MQRLLAISAAIDALSRRLGRFIAWAIVAAFMIGAVNAIVRKAFDLSSNAWSEVQWWLFSAAFLLAAPWALLDNEHIRIDVVSNSLTKRTRDWIDVAGHALFLIPMSAVLLYTSWFYFLSAYERNEQALNAGGLPQWPIKALIPAAFAFLMLQGLSELVKRIAIIRGLIPEPGHGARYHEAVTAAGGSDGESR